MAKHHKICVVCGKPFHCSPSDNKLTCSKTCRSLRRSAVLTGHKVTAATSQKMSSSAKARGVPVGFAAKGTAAAKKSPLSGRYPTNLSAKSWSIRSPYGGIVYTFNNLRDWCRNNVDVYSACFPEGLSPEEMAYRMAKGITAIKSRIKRNAPPFTYKGWEIIAKGDSLCR